MFFYFDAPHRILCQENHKSVKDFGVLIIEDSNNNKVYYIVGVFNNLTPALNLDMLK